MIKNLSISYGSDNGGNIFQDSLLIENGTGIRLSYIYDHDWYKTAPTGGVNYELANSINDNIYTKGRVSVGGVHLAEAILDVDGGMGNIYGIEKPGLKIKQEWWGPGQSGTNGQTRLIKLDHFVGQPHDQTTVVGYGIDYQLFSQGQVFPAGYVGTADYYGISSRGNARSNENFTAGYFKATNSGTGTSTALHSDGVVKMENLDEDLADTDKMLVIGSDDKVYWKNLTALVGCNVNYYEDFSTWSSTTGTIPIGWQFNPGNYRCRSCWISGSFGGLYNTK